MRVTVHRINFAMHLSGIADPAAPVFHRVRIDPLSVPPGPRYADPIILARHRREVADDHGKLVRISAATRVRKDTLGRIRSIDPGETVGIAVELIERRRAA